MPSYAFQIDTTGDSAEKIKQIKAAIEQMGGKLKDIPEHANKIKNAFGGLISQFKGLAGALGVGLGAFAGFSFIKQSKEAFDKFEESVVKIETAIKSTGGAAQLSLSQLGDEAKKLSGVSLFSRASIMDAQSMLLTFTQIKGTVFNEAIPAIMDFATRYKTDPVEAALQVGKALNDPEKGLHRLSRMGVVFSAQQEAQIKKFMAVNDVASAQRVMLKELNTEFGGLAEAMTKTDEGKLKMAAKTMQEFKIQVGELVSKILVMLIPAFNTVVKLFKEFKDWITGDSESAYIFKEIIVVIGGALLGYLVVVNAIALATKIWTAFQWLLNIAMSANPIGIVIIAVVALIAAIAALWDKCEGFRKIVGGVFAEIAKVIMGIVHYFVNLAKIMYDVFTFNFKDAWAQGKKFISDFKNDFLQGWGEAWDKGSKKAQESKFKFGGLIGLGGKKDQEKSAEERMKMGMGGGPGGLAQGAINTAALGGASGGLGEAKIIKIDFHAPLMKIDVPGGNGMDIVSKAPLAMESLIRIANNLSQSQGSTM